jgi:hypothetical protein
VPSTMCVLVLLAPSCYDVIPLASFGSVLFWCSLSYLRLLWSMLFALPSRVLLFGFVSYHLVMILRNSTDHEPIKAFAQVCPGLGS